MVAKTMPAMDSLKLDRDHYYQQPLTGFYRLPCTVRQGEEREAAVYIPENSEFNQPTVMIFVPEGVDSGAFLEDSGWAQAAEEEKLRAEIAKLRGEQAKQEVHPLVSDLMAAVKKNQEAGHAE